MKNYCLLFMLVAFSPLVLAKKPRPNVILIYADDLGFGDLSCYGAKVLKTPHLDRLAAQGLRFTNAHTTSSTCTPSRYALMTGKYPWRKQGTGVLPGDAALIIPTDKVSFPKVFKQSGYSTGIVGKWHLGLGDTKEKNWNKEIKPGPNEVGFDYSFIFPATADRVPTVFIENNKVIGLDQDDTIRVNYQTKIGTEPSGQTDRSLLKMPSSANHGHEHTIINGVGRIGYMSGAKMARWTDEEVSFSFLIKAQEFIENNKDHPFFLFFALTEPHVPRVPATMFKGSSGLGYRGDAILQLDWTVGQIMKQLKYLGLEQNTILMLTSDNGPVYDDGYEDDAVIKKNGHLAAGPLRGGKYSIFEGGTRVPWIIRWPQKIKPGVSNASLSQVDLIASFAGFLHVSLDAGEKLDSENHFDALVGKTSIGREHLIEHAGTLAIIQGPWKYIAPSNGSSYYALTDTETGLFNVPQLYHLEDDPGEKNNLAATNPAMVQRLAGLLEKVKTQ